MRLSMYILADWLKKYAPQEKIQSGERRIRNTRLFSDEQRYTQNNVYVSSASDDTHKIICMNGNDYLQLEADNENQVINDIIDAFDYYNGWSDDLNYRLPELTMGEIIQSGADVLGHLIIVVDASHRILCHSELPQNIVGREVLQKLINREVAPLEYITESTGDPLIRQPLRNSYYATPNPEAIKAECSLRNLFTHRRQWGWMILFGNHITRGEQQIQDTLGDIMERWMELHEEQQDELEMTSVFVDILEEGRPNKEQLMFRLQQFGWKKTDRKVVCVLRWGGDGYEKSSAYVGFVSKQLLGGYAFVYRDDLVLVCNLDMEGWPHMEPELARLLSQSGGHGGRSQEFVDIFDLPKQYGFAVAALDFPAEEKTITWFSDIAYQYGMAVIARQSADYLVHPALKCLREYDSRNKTSLYETLRCVLTMERNYAHASQALFIHRSTLLYRMDCIKRLTNLDLNRADTRLHLLISFAIDG